MTREKTPAWREQIHLDGERSDARLMDKGYLCEE